SLAPPGQCRNNSVNPFFAFFSRGFLRHWPGGAKEVGIGAVVRRGGLVRRTTARPKTTQPGQGCEKPLRHLCHEPIKPGTDTSPTGWPWTARRCRKSSWETP